MQAHRAEKPARWSPTGAVANLNYLVDCKAVGTGAKALVYLGRYLYRGVIREQDILACHNGQVTFRYQDVSVRPRHLASSVRLNLWGSTNW